MKRHLVMLAAALLSVGLASCSAEQEPPTDLPEQEPSAAGLPGGAPAGAPPAGSTPPDRPEPPLTQFLNEIYGLDVSAQERAEQQRREHTQIEDETASCMRQEGFDYTPRPFVPSTAQPGVSADGVSDDDMSDRDWVARYGYGLVETPARPIGQTVDGRDEEGTADPNGDYVSGLSASQRAAYETALYGEQPTAEELDAGWDLSQGGCYGRATLAASGVNVRDLKEFEPFFEATDEFAESALSWDGVAALDADWASCMDDNGHPGYARQADASNEISSRYTALWQEANPNWVHDRVQNTQPPSDALQALAAQERALALVDLDCREQVDYQARYDAIAVREEERFMTDHAADVTALRAAAEQGGSR
ncbi:hypothetical protein AGMMS50218_04350 [Actinomycetota bacterium]|nr:hypothetical protein AGMMS50218_04350 [Actinomycetota bacterium]